MSSMGFPMWNANYRRSGDTSWSMATGVPTPSPKSVGYSTLTEGGPVTMPFPTVVGDRLEGGDPVENFMIRGEYCFVGVNRESPTHIYKIATVANINLSARMAENKFREIIGNKDQLSKQSTLFQQIAGEYKNMPECNRQLLNEVSISQVGNRLTFEEYDILSYMSARAFHTRWKPGGVFSNTEGRAGDTNTHFLVNLNIARVHEMYPYWQDAEDGNELYFCWTRHYDSKRVAYTYFELVPVIGKDKCRGIYLDEFGYVCQSIPIYVGTCRMPVQVFGRRWGQSPGYYAGIPALLGQRSTLQTCIKEYTSLGSTKMEVTLGDRLTIFPAETLRTLPLSTKPRTTTQMVTTRSTSSAMTD